MEQYAKRVKQLIKDSSDSSESRDQINPKQKGNKYSSNKNLLNNERSENQQEEDFTQRDVIKDKKMEKLKFSPQRLNRQQISQSQQNLFYLQNRSNKFDPINNSSSRHQRLSPSFNKNMDILNLTVSEEEEHLKKLNCAEQKNHLKNKIDLLMREIQLQKQKLKGKRKISQNSKVLNTKSSQNVSVSSQEQKKSKSRGKQSKNSSQIPKLRNKSRNQLSSLEERDSGSLQKTKKGKNKNSVSVSKRTLSKKRKSSGSLTKIKNQVQPKKKEFLSIENIENQKDSQKQIHYSVIKNSSDNNTNLFKSQEPLSSSRLIQIEEKKQLQQARQDEIDLQRKQQEQKNRVKELKQSIDDLERRNSKQSLILSNEQLEQNENQEQQENINLRNNLFVSSSNQEDKIFIEQQRQFKQDSIIGNENYEGKQSENNKINMQIIKEMQDELLTYKKDFDLIVQEKEENEQKALYWEEQAYIQQQQAEELKQQFEQKIQEMEFQAQEEQENFASKLKEFEEIIQEYQQKMEKEDNQENLAFENSELKLELEFLKKQIEGKEQYHDMEIENLNKNIESLRKTNEYYKNQQNNNSQIPILQETQIYSPSKQLTDKKNEREKEFLIQEIKELKSEIYQKDSQMKQLEAEYISQLETINLKVNAFSNNTNRNSILQEENQRLRQLVTLEEKKSLKIQEKYEQYKHKQHQIQKQLIQQINTLKQEVDDITNENKKILRKIM